MPSVLRTPETRFANLPGFPYEPRYVQIDGVRMHYIDEGRGDPILCLHGEPTWSCIASSYPHSSQVIASSHLTSSALADPTNCRIAPTIPSRYTTTR